MNKLIIIAFALLIVALCSCSAPVESQPLSCKSSYEVYALCGNKAYTLTCTQPIEDPTGFSASGGALCELPIGEAKAPGSYSSVWCCQ